MSEIFTSKIRNYVRQKYAPRSARIGADSRLASIKEWEMLQGNLQREGMQLIPIASLLDQLWNEELDPEKRRPEFNRVVAKLHNSSYTGKQLTGKEG